MISSPSLPVIVTCSGCLLALVVGLVFRATTFVGYTARLGFLPKGLTRWLYDVKDTNTTN
jgi:hypothetical protein